MLTTLLAALAALPLAAPAAEPRGGDAPSGPEPTLAATASLAAPVTAPVTAPDDTARLSFALDRPKPWTVQIEPAAWFVAPSGKVKLPQRSGAAGPRSDKVRVEDLNLDADRFSPFGEVHIQAEEWRFSLSAANYDLSTDFVPADSPSRLVGDTRVGAGGLPVRTEYEFTTAELTAGYRVFCYDFTEKSEHPEDAADVVLTLHALGGVRLYNSRVSVEGAPSPGAASVRSSADEFFAEPIIGFRVELEVIRDFTIDTQVSGGAWPESDHSSASIDIVLGFTWRPHPNVGLQIGWRQLAFSLSDGKDRGEFENDGRLAGLYGGLTFRF